MKIIAKPLSDLVEAIKKGPLIDSDNDIDDDDDGLTLEDARKIMEDS
jgi:hypothetical protein